MAVEVINVSSGSEDWRAHTLSNFPCFPFELDGMTFASVEGFIQGIKLPEEDSRRQQAFTLWGKHAKQIGTEAKRESVWWNGQQFVYGENDHRALIRRAIVAKFYYNEGARLALMATGDAELIHDVGPESPHTSLTAAYFCEILRAIRWRLNKKPLDRP